MSLEEALQELREYCRGMPPVAAMQVEVEGMRGYPPSCATPAAEGMVVRTQTEALRKLRQEVRSGAPRSRRRKHLALPSVPL